MAYIDRNLTKGETIVVRASFKAGYLVKVWLKGILFCWLLLIPLIKAIIATVKFRCSELALTNKRVIGKLGVVDSASLDLPLNKIQSVGVKSGFWGKIFNHADITISSAAGNIVFSGVSHAEDFKRAVMAQIEQYEEDRVKEQAEQMASAMSKAMKG